MRPARLFLVVILFCVYLPLHARSKHLIVLGKLTQAAAPNGDSSTWCLQLNPVITVDGRQLSFLEIKTDHPQKLELLQDAYVQAKGTLLTSDAADTSAVPILKLSSVHSVKYNNPDKEKPKSSLWSSVANFFSTSPI